MRADAELAVESEAAWSPWRLTAVARAREIGLLDEFVRDAPAS
jgi:hypothetical protein